MSPGSRCVAADPEGLHGKIRVASAATTATKAVMLMGRPPTRAVRLASPGGLRANTEAPPRRRPDGESQTIGPTAA